MPISRRTFLKGIMDQDTDERLLPDGVYIEAENVLIVNSEGSDVGAIENALSNKQLTNLDLGANPKCLLGFADEFEDKLYWFILSDSGCFLIEWDNKNELISFVLKDTRPSGAGRVLDLKETHLITGVEKIINEDSKKNLFLWTDDNIQPCCINIERAKAYGENNFEIEDIYLIKKPPRYAPIITPTYTNDLSNNLEERFLSFSYRYKYLDGEYSALSDYSNYTFTPRPFELDYFTLDNVGMLNAFNAAKIEFNTGDKRVTEVQLIVKNSNSNNLYIIESFNKEKEGWTDGIVKSHIFSNNKIYAVLPEKEIYRSFDNVPLKAKALTMIGNRPVFGNYVEGYDIVDDNNNKINIDYSLSLINDPISESFDFTTEIVSENNLEITNPEGFLLTEGSVINFYINILLDNQDVYDGNFYLILENNYASLFDLVVSDEFAVFFNILNSDYVANYNSNSNYDVPDGWVVSVETELTYEMVGTTLVVTVSPVTFIDTFDSDTEHVVNTSISETSALEINYDVNSKSCKTNRDYEVAIVYEDNFNRKTIGLTAPYNTIYIPQKYSVFKNKIRVNINHKPPSFADRYKLIVKANPLQYQTIYVNEFYNEDFYVWCRLVAENKDKVKVGDELIIKTAAGTVINNPIAIKVLDLEKKDKNFIIDNNDSEGNIITEPESYYMKIKPNGFSMDFNDYKIYQTSGSNSARKRKRYEYPNVPLELFSNLITDNGDVNTNIYEQIKIPSGSSFELYINSLRKYDDGWRSIGYQKTFFAQKDYETLEEFMIDNIMNSNLYATDTYGEVFNYKNKIQLIEGNVDLFVYNSEIMYEVNPRPGGKLFLLVEGYTTGGSNRRSGYLQAKVTIRTSVGLYVFETKPKQADNNFFYETEQAFDIVDGQHTANNQNQDIDTFTPAIVDLDFFNCYTQGNGVESYRIKDGFNTNYLNIDLRPSSTSTQEYAQIRRFADLTYGEPFVESSNINGLNEFNLSTVNFKELDKIYGSIQKLHSRDNDILVLQEEKASKVLFGKDALYSANGDSNLTSFPQVLGQQITYLGDNGISTNPESFAVNDYQIFYTNAKRGLVHRLSIDGVSSIVSSMTDFFRDLFRLQPNAKKVGAYDSYHDQYTLSIDDEPIRYLTVSCNNSIYKSKLTESFTYQFIVNDLEGDIVLNYNIISGNATITALFDGNLSVVSNVNGLGSIVIPRTNLSENIVTITITPITDSIDFEITNSCPLGIEMKLAILVLCDENDSNKTILNKYRWSGNSFNNNEETLNNAPVSRYEILTGIEGTQFFPRRNNLIELQSFRRESDTAKFYSDRENKLGYLISTTEYTESEYEDIVAAATWLTITNENLGFISEINKGAFLFNKTADNEILYLIYNYIDVYHPDGVADFARVDPTTPWTPGGFNGVNILVKDNEIDIPLDWDIILDTLPLYITQGQAFIDISNTKIIFNTASYPNGGDGSFNYKRTDGTNTSNDIPVHVAVGFDNTVFLETESRVGNIVLWYYFGFNTGTGSIHISLELSGSVSITYNDDVVSTQAFLAGEDHTITFPKDVSDITCAKITITTTGKWGVYSTIKP